MKTPTTKTPLFLAIASLALAGSTMAGPRLSEHEQLVKTFEEDLGFARMSFYSDIRWFHGGKMTRTEDAFFEHVGEAKKCAVALGEAMRCNEGPRAVAYHLKMTRESLDCVNEFAPRVGLCSKASLFLESANKSFDELERCMLPKRTTHRHTHVEPFRDDDRHRSEAFRRERTEIDPRELIVRSIFVHLRDR